MKGVNEYILKDILCNLSNKFTTYKISCQLARQDLGLGENKWLGLIRSTLIELSS